MNEKLSEIIFNIQKILQNFNMGKAINTLSAIWNNKSKTKLDWCHITELSF